MIDSTETILLQYIAIVVTDQAKRAGRNRVVFPGEGVANDIFK
jgi:hypothetical protein